MYFVRKNKIPSKIFKYIFKISNIFKIFDNNFIFPDFVIVVNKILQITE